MLVIRLQRVGRRHQPSYRLVVSERRSKLGGPPVEDLGSYNPFSKTIAFKQERINHWLGTGAKPTVTVHNLLVKQGIVGGPKIKISISKAEVKPKVLKDEVPEILKNEVPVEEKPAEVAAETAPEVPAEQPAA
ncbi:MAG: 30S ribosomal protein S16 [bacterium]|nr:30S ribosomal protein S16 [bacterium]